MPCTLGLGRTKPAQTNAHPLSPYRAQPRYLFLDSVPRSCCLRAMHLISQVGRTLLYSSALQQAPFQTHAAAPARCHSGAPPPCCCCCWAASFSFRRRAAAASLAAMSLSRMPLATCSGSLPSCGLSQ